MFYHPNQVCFVVSNRENTVIAHGTMPFNQLNNEVYQHYCAGQDIPQPNGYFPYPTVTNERRSSNESDGDFQLEDVKNGYIQQPPPFLVKPFIYPLHVHVGHSDKWGIYRSPFQSPAESEMTMGSQSTLVEIDDRYSQSSVNGIYPHMENEKRLAELFRGCSQNMQVVWDGAFNMLSSVFTQVYMHNWQLRPAFDNLPREGHLWDKHREDAKVRFKCWNCGKGWTSMKGKVVFCFKLDYAEGVGEVVFQLYGQKCTNCMPDNFQHAMWYPAEVWRVLKLLIYKIGHRVYKIPKPKVLRERRGGSPKEKHEKEHCEACLQGICSTGM